MSYAKICFFSQRKKPSTAPFCSLWNVKKAILVKTVATAGSMLTSSAAVKLVLLPWCWSFCLCHKMKEDDRWVTSWLSLFKTNLHHQESRVPVSPLPNDTQPTQYPAPTSSLAGGGSMESLVDEWLEDWVKVRCTVKAERLWYYRLCPTLTDSNKHWVETKRTRL